MNNIPDWWAFLLLALAAFRVYRLIAEDTILDGPRAWALGYRGWDGKGSAPKGYRAKWGEFITCPWCCGAHVSWMLWLCFLWQPHITLVACTPFALSAVVALTAKNLDRDEE